MLKQYPIFKRFQIQDFYKKLNKTDKDLLDKYVQYRKARGVSSYDKIESVKREMLHIIFILGKDYNKMDIHILRDLIVLINTAKLSEHYKNNIKSDLKNFLKYKYPDWSSRFSGLDDIKTNNGINQEKINSKTLFSKEDIEKLMKHENKMFWKAFLIAQYEGGLRTKEVRYLKWEDIKFNVDGDISEISIYATKTKQARTIFVKQASFYLRKLKEEQENLGTKAVYVFNLNDKPVDKFNVSKWFRGLTKKALGRLGWNYLLRHSRATELYTLAMQNKISKDIAAKFMGHSEDMSEIYLHLDQKSIQEMTKNQVYNIEELPKEKLQEFEEMKKDNVFLKKELGEILDMLCQPEKDFTNIFKDKRNGLLKSENLS